MEISDQVWTTILVGAFGVLTAYLTLSAPRRMAKLNNEATAEALRIANERADRIAAEARADRQAQAADIGRKLAGMHALVNGVYSAAKRNEIHMAEEALAALIAADWLSSTTDNQVKILKLESDLKIMREELAKHDATVELVERELARTPAEKVVDAAHVPGVQVRVDPEKAPQDVVQASNSLGEPDIVPMTKPGEP